MKETTEVALAVAVSIFVLLAMMGCCLAPVWMVYDILKDHRFEYEAFERKWLCVHCGAEREDDGFYDG